MFIIDISSRGFSNQEGRGYVNDIFVSLSSLGSSPSDQGSFERGPTYVNSVITPIQPVNKGPTKEEGPVREQGL